MIYAEIYSWSFCVIKTKEVSYMKASVKNDSTKPLILVADDDEACLDVLVKMLAVMGYDVFAVRNGKAAIEAYSSMKHQINLVMLDMEMPYNGEKTYQKLRKIDNHARILLISGYTEDFKVSALLNQGYCGFLKKPFNMNSLKANVTNILKPTVSG
jgi:two-component system, cell cycle sensor histidine kinase and response regulator CckA